jgi:hypothetical protein
MVVKYDGMIGQGNRVKKLCAEEIRTRRSCTDKPAWRAMIGVWLRKQPDSTDRKSAEGETTGNVGNAGNASRKREQKQSVGDLPSVTGEK